MELGYKDVMGMNRYGRLLGNYRKLIKAVMIERPDLFMVDSGFIRVDRMPLEVSFEDYVKDMMLNYGDGNGFRFLYSTWMGAEVYMMNWDILICFGDEGVEYMKSRFIESGINIDHLFN